MLHSPCATMDDPSDASRAKLLQAATSIVESVHQMTATSYDFALLPDRAIAGWSVAARTLVRFYRYSLEHDHMEDAEAIRAEISVVGCVHGDLFPCLFNGSAMLLFMCLGPRLADAQRHSALITEWHSGEWVNVFPWRIAPRKKSRISPMRHYGTCRNRSDGDSRDQIPRKYTSVTKRWLHIMFEARSRCFEGVI